MLRFHIMLTAPANHILKMAFFNAVREDVSHAESTPCNRAKRHAHELRKLHAVVANPPAAGPHDRCG